MGGRGYSGLVCGMVVGAILVLFVEWGEGLFWSRLWNGGEGLFLVSFVEWGGRGYSGLVCGMRGRGYSGLVCGMGGRGYSGLVSGISGSSKYPG